MGHTQTRAGKRGEDEEVRIKNVTCLDLNFPNVSTKLACSKLLVVGKKRVQARQLRGN